jgi:hypothetical protein
VLLLHPTIVVRYCNAQIDSTQRCWVIYLFIKMFSTYKILCFYFWRCISSILHITKGTGEKECIRYYNEYNHDRLENDMCYYVCNATYVYVLYLKSYLELGKVLPTTCLIACIKRYTLDWVWLLWIVCAQKWCRA